MSGTRWQEEYRRQVEDMLERLLPSERDELFAGVIDAMRYSLLGGGKRIRPILLLEFCRLCGGDPNKALPWACALEMIHSYSLIHDDLPCMDDAATRRGQPSCHKKFDEATALLAGDALLTLAFEVIAASGGSDRQRADACLCLARAAGGRGMVYGQELDLAFENKQPKESDLIQIHTHKTGDLINAAGRLGVIASTFTPKDEAECDAYTRAVGLVFQIVDDLLDCTATAQQLGKPVGSDAAAGKVTFATLKGMEAAQEQAQQLTEKACAELEACYGEKAAFLTAFARSLVVRKN